MRLIDADEFERRIKMYDTTDYADKALYNFAHNEMITMPTVDVLDKIRAEILECLEAIKHIKAMPIQLYPPNEIEARKLTYEQCLGFIDKYR